MYHEYVIYLKDGISHSSLVCIPTNKLCLNLVFFLSFFKSRIRSPFPGKNKILLIFLYNHFSFFGQTIKMGS